MPDAHAYGDPARSLVVLRVPPTSAGWTAPRAARYPFAFLSLMLAASIAVCALGRNHGPPVLTILGKVRLALVGFTLLGLVFFGLGASPAGALPSAQAGG
ncbi:MAG: hypothetical protein IPM68_09610 [Flavobacteriales bacterium]|nr:hypothetical protein [Flavobacteriales bacterium]